MHLEGNRIISLQKLHDAICTITQHNAACKSPVDLIGEVQRNGLSSGVATLGHWPYHQPLWPYHQYFNLSLELLTIDLYKTIG